MFQAMLDQSLFMACSILKKKGERPGVNNFEKKISDWCKEIMEMKISLLG